MTKNEAEKSRLCQRPIRALPRGKTPAMSGSVWVRTGFCCLALILYIGLADCGTKLTNPAFPNGDAGGPNGPLNGVAAGPNGPSADPAGVLTGPLAPPALAVGVDYSTQVAPIFSKCIACHGGTMGFFFENYSNIESSAIGQVSSFGMTELKRFDSEGSYLIWKIEGRPTIDGSQMPRGGPPLSSGEIQTMKDWISQGILEGPDTTRPNFAGATAANPASAGQIRIDWAPADDVAGATTTGSPIDTPPSLIIYNIYQSEGASVTDVTTPTYVAPAGSTGFTVDNLNPNTEYFFVVRAVDATGNVDANTVEVSATTTASTETPPPPAPSPTAGLLIAHEDVPGDGELFGFSIDYETWGSQCFAPTLSPDAVSWGITRVEFMARQISAEETLVVELRTAIPQSGGYGGLEPTGEVLATAAVPTASLPTSWDWVEVSFAGVSGLDPSQPVCLVISQVSGSTGAEIRVEDKLNDSTSSANTLFLTTDDMGVRWRDEEEEQDMIFRVFGIVTTN